jgi:predicted nucleic acid-binding protein
VLAWLFGEPSGEATREALASAEMVLASELTLVECDRVLIRAQMAGGIGEAELADRRAALNRSSAHWHLVRLGGEVLERARRPFPKESVRTLDALHLASALVARAAMPGLSFLSLDRRVRSSAAALGFAVVPEAEG